MNKQTNREIAIQNRVKELDKAVVELEETINKLLEEIGK